MAKRGSKLTDLERQFIKEYLIDFNGAAAVRRAGYQIKRTKVRSEAGKDYFDDGARHLAYELLTKPHIVAQINREMERRCKKLELTADFTLGRLKTLARSNVKNVAEWAEGRLKIHDSAMLTEEAAYQIESLHMKQTKDGPEVKLKMRSPNDALKLLAEHQGLLETGGNQEAPEELTEAIRELEKEEKKP